MLLSEPAPTQYDWKFKFNGIPVRVHPFFWLVALFLGISPQSTPGQMIVWVLCLFVSILIHEYGHAATARRFGSHNVRILLYAMGGLATSAGALNRRQRLQHILWGPGAGFVLWAIVCVVSFLIPEESLSPLARYAIIQLKWINLVWGLVNLIPVMPLDGGQVMRELLTKRHGQRATLRAHQLSMRISAAAAIIFAILAIFGIAPWFAVFVFAILCTMNYQLSQQLSAMGNIPSEPRQAWQRDSDWWKQ